MNTSAELITQLWRQFEILREGGLTAGEALQELWLLLFWKMRQETVNLPSALRWQTLLDKPVLSQINYYRKILRQLPQIGDAFFSAVYTEAKTKAQDSARFAMVLRGLHNLNWERVQYLGFAEVYEDFLEKYAGESSDPQAWFLFPPPQLVNTLVALLQPEAGEVVLDPLAASGAFLTAAEAYSQTVAADETEEAILPLKVLSLLGLEKDPVRRLLAQINIALHGMDNASLYPFTVGGKNLSLSPADVLVSNALPADPETEAALLRSSIAALKPAGRAAVIVSDELLRSEIPVCQKIRAELLNTCNLHTLLRLPAGIFYQQPALANVLFFSRQPSTLILWVYDLRTGVSSYTDCELPMIAWIGFETAFGDDPQGLSARCPDQQQRFRPFSRAELAEKHNRLDCCWLENDRLSAEETAFHPEHFQQWMDAELEALAQILGEEG